MKTPTLEEVKEYFKNAKEVFCLTDNEAVDITKNITRDIHFFMDIYWIGIDHIGGGDVNLWKNGKYAEIISYIEPTTKVRNSVLLQLAENNSYSEEILKKECPKLFECEIEINNYYWVKHDNLQNALVFIQGKEVKNTYGFSHKFEFTDMYRNDLLHGTYKKDIIRKATPQEVETALIQEAKKRGYKLGIEVVDIYNGKTEKDTTIISSNKFDYEIIKAGSIQGDMALRDSDGNIIFHNGIWASIIETPTDIITIVEKYGKDKVISLIEKM